MGVARGARGARVGDGTAGGPCVAAGCRRPAGSGGTTAAAAA